MKSHPAFIIGLLGLMCLLSACGSSAEAGSSAAASAEPASATPDPSARTPRSAAAEPCPTGALCNGLTAPGTYTTSTIPGATISISLESEWEVQTDAAARFVNLYHHGGVPAIIGMATMPGEVFAEPCDDGTTNEIERTPQALMDWLAAHPAMELGEVAPVTVGDAAGLQVELTATKAEPCPTESGVAPDLILLWPLVEGAAFVLTDETTAIVYALEIGGELVVVTAETIFDPDPWRPVVQPVLESLEFRATP